MKQHSRKEEFGGGEQNLLMGWIEERQNKDERRKRS